MLVAYLGQLTSSYGGNVKAAYWRSSGLGLHSSAYCTEVPAFRLQSPCHVRRDSFALIFDRSFDGFTGHAAWRTEDTSHAANQLDVSPLTTLPGRGRQGWCSTTLVYLSIAHVHDPSYQSSSPRCLCSRLPIFAMASRYMRKGWLNTWT
jgi:hypothetical protein